MVSDACDVIVAVVVSPINLSGEIDLCRIPMGFGPQASPFERYRHDAAFYFLGREFRHGRFPGNPVGALVANGLICLYLIKCQPRRGNKHE